MRRPQGVVLIAEYEPPSPMDVDHLSHGLRQMDARYVELLKSLFAKAEFELTHYAHPFEFMRRIDEHRDDVVISFWHGNLSRNAVGLVPAICEAAEIDYFGADAFARILCDDKLLSRDLAQRMGFTTADAILIDREPSPNALQDLKLPVVVKPIIGGMSTGVVQVNGNENDRFLPEVISGILREFGHPVLVEAFCPGREVMIVLVGDRQDLDIFCATEVFLLEDPSWLHDRIFSAAIKRTMTPDEWGIRAITGEIPDEIRRKCHRLFQALGDVHYLRIDGRLSDGEFTFIELSTTPHFWPATALSCAAATYGISQADIIRRFVELARRRATTHSAPVRSEAEGNTPSSTASNRAAGPANTDGG